MTNWLVLMADLAIAGVIYYEVEQTRAATFLASASEDAYRAREAIYDAYTQTPGKTHQERTTAFCERLRKNKHLRRKVDVQLVEFSRAQYLLRWSVLHHDLMVTWFAPVIVRLWVILEPYIREKEKVQLKWEHMWPGLVEKSFRRLEREGLAPMTIFSNDGEVTITVGIAELQAIAAQLRKLQAS